MTLFWCFFVNFEHISNLFLVFWCFFVNFEHISNLFLVFWLLTLNNHMVSFNSKLINFSLITLFLISWGKSLLAPNLLSANPWNGRTHSNNSSAINDELFMSLLDYFVGLALKGLKLNYSDIRDVFGTVSKIQWRILKNQPPEEFYKNGALKDFTKVTCARASF